MNSSRNLILAGLLVAFSAPALAGPMQFWEDESWIQFNDKPATEDGEIAPGAGGQKFDAEYLFFKLSGSTLSIGLQAGFDIEDGHYRHSDGKDYYSGDLALSFDGDVTLGSSVTYEYGFDFGLYTESYNNSPGAIDFTSGTGIDSSGLYLVSQWSEDIYTGHSISNPYAIDEVSAAFGGSTSAGQEGDSFYRIVSFDLTGLNATYVDAHWTMSCGNDNINGGFQVNVPEPESLALFLLGLTSVGFSRIRQRRVGARAMV